MKIAIMTDTSSGISEQEAKENGIFLLPRSISIDAQIFKEGINLDKDTLYNAIKAKKELITLEPSATVTKQLWDEIFAQGYETIIFIPSSTSLNDPHNVTLKIAKEYGSKIFIIDNHRISISLKNSVYDAKYLIDTAESTGNEISLKEIKEILDFNAAQNFMYIAVDDTKRVAKTVKLPTLSSMMNAKFIFKLESGQLEILQKGKGMKGCEKAMLEAVSQELKRILIRVPQESICISATGTFETDADAKKWIDKIKKVFPKYAVDYKPLPNSIACTVGLNAEGVTVERVERKLL